MNMIYLDYLQEVEANRIKSQKKDIKMFWILFIMTLVETGGLDSKMPY